MIDLNDRQQIQKMIQDSVKGYLRIPQNYVGSPVGNIQPRYFGDTCVDPTNNNVYVADGLTTSDWVKTDTNALVATRGNWKTFYSDGSGVFTELALGAAGTYLQSNGAAAVPTFVTPTNTGLKMGVVGISTGAGIGANRLNGVRFALPLASTIQKLLIHMGNTVGGNIKMGIYSDNAGSPNALLGTTGEIVVAATDDYYDVVGTLTTPLALTAGNYWLAFLSDTDLTVGYYITSTQKAYYKNTVGYSTGLPDPFGAITATQVAWSIAAF